MTSINLKGNSIGIESQRKKKIQISFNLIFSIDLKKDL